MKKVMWVSTPLLHPEKIRHMESRWADAKNNLEPLAKHLMVDQRCKPDDALKGFH